MTEADQDGDKGSAAQAGTGAQTPDPKPKTPAAEQADRQDKTKDKPDSGQNEDG